MDSKPVKLVGIGINVVDIYRHQGKMYPGGNEYNICYHAKELGGVVGFMGVFAHDPAGELLAALFRGKGIDLSRSRFECGSSGYAIVDLVEGDRVFVDWNKQGVTDLHPISFSEEDLAYIGNFDIACASYASRLTIEEIDKLKSTPAMVSYDFSDSFTKENLRNICPGLDFAFLSCSHLEDIETVQSILKTATECGSKIAIATLGRKGALAFDGSDFNFEPSLPNKAKDTMGAGDSFIAAFLMAYFSETNKNCSGGDRIQNSLQQAARFASEIVMKEGALGICHEIDINDIGKYIDLK